MKKNFKTWLCSVLVLGTTLAIGLFAAGCSKDDFKNKVDQAFCEHNYGAVATKTVREATCTAEGEELWTCIECGKEKTVVLDKLEHDFSTSKGGWTKTKQAATCREEGIQESRCGVCKTIVTESIAKLPHTEVSVEQQLPTCTVAGHTEYTYCSACNDFITPKVTIPALGHNVEIVKGYEATCDSKGLTDGKVCLDCDEVLVEQKDIPALGHKIEYLAPVEPTCEMTGLTAGYACVRCDKVYTAQNVVEKLPHVDEDEDGFCDDCIVQLLPDTSGMIAQTLTSQYIEGFEGKCVRVYFSDVNPVEVGGETYFEIPLLYHSNGVLSLKVYDSTGIVEFITSGDPVYIQTLSGVEVLYVGEGFVDLYFGYGWELKLAPTSASAPIIQYNAQYSGDAIYWGSAVKLLVFPDDINN